MRLNRDISVSNLLIITSIVITIFSNIDPNILKYGMNIWFLNEHRYDILVVQFLLYSFLHGGFVHVLSNSIFIYLFGNPLEHAIGERWFIVFFVFTTIINAIALLVLNPYMNTIGISGFALAILSFYTLLLYEVRHPDYKGGIVAIILNIVIGFNPQISLVGHLFGAISGVLFYFIYRYLRKN